MIAKSEREQIIALINREVIPAIGCTEPIAVALCVAKATETLGCKPEKIQALLSANILKNAMGVGIPGTGMIGLPIAIALGALIGKSEYQLEVLKDSTPEAVEVWHRRKTLYRNHLRSRRQEGNSNHQWWSYQLRICGSWRRGFSKQASRFCQRNYYRRCRTHSSQGVRFCHGNSD